MAMEYLTSKIMLANVPTPHLRRTYGKDHFIAENYFLSPITALEGCYDWKDNGDADLGIQTSRRGNLICEWT